MPRSSESSGRATFTAEMSRITISWAIARSIRSVRRLGARDDMAFLYSDSSVWVSKSDKGVRCQAAPRAIGHTYARRVVLALAGCLPRRGAERYALTSGASAFALVVERTCR